MSSIATKPAERARDHIARAVSKIDARKLADGRYAYHDDGMRRWYVCGEDELETLGELLTSDDEKIRAVAYSLWCGATPATEATLAQIAEATS